MPPVYMQAKPDPSNKGVHPMKRFATALTALLTLLAWPTPTTAEPHIEAIYQTCLERPAENLDAIEYWMTHPDAERGICTSTEATQLHEGRGLAYLSGATWIAAIMLDVRHCESRGNYRAKNPGSSAAGGWQFLDSTWEEVTGLPGPASAYSVEVQDRAAVKLYARAGTRPWNASRHCWG